MNNVEAKRCPFCGDAEALSLAMQGETRFIRCTCGAAGPIVKSRAMDTIFGIDLVAIEHWNDRFNPEADKIYTALQGILPDFTVAGGFPCQVEKRHPEVTVLNFPSFDFQLKLFRDGTWEVERNGRLEKSQEGDVEISGPPTEKTR